MMVLPSSEPSLLPNWLELPREVTSKILRKLDAFEILMSAQWVCSLWCDICKDPQMWRTIAMNNLQQTTNCSLQKLEIMCRHAVDRSCGQLQAIHVKIFGTDALLKDIADSSNHLRSIRFVFCWSISDEGLIEAAPKLPLLEELDISSCNVSKDSLEAIGRFCPLLKSLIFNKININNRTVAVNYDEEAFTIAQTMPRLVNLELRGNMLTNAGLLAILDVCPLLESLNLRGCFNVGLRGSLGKRCAEQIKDFFFSDFCPTQTNDYADIYEELLHFL